MVPPSVRNRLSRISPTAEDIQIQSMTSTSNISKFETNFGRSSIIIQNQLNQEGSSYEASQSIERYNNL